MTVRLFHKLYERSIAWFILLLLEAYEHLFALIQQRVKHLIISHYAIAILLFVKIEEKLQNLLVNMEGHRILYRSQSLSLSFDSLLLFKFLLSLPSKLLFFLFSFLLICRLLLSFQLWFLLRLLGTHLDRHRIFLLFRGSSIGLIYDALTKRTWRAKANLVQFFQLFNCLYLAW